MADEERTENSESSNEDSAKEPQKEGAVDIAQAPGIKGEGALKEQLLRLSAEFENYKKRMQKEKEEYKQYATEELIVGILPILDSMDEAVKRNAGTGPKKAEQSELYKGLVMLDKQLRSVLEKAGVRAIECKGSQFDPYTQEAISQAECTEFEEGTVMEEVQKGYRLNSKILRTSKVIVAKGNKADNPYTGGAEGGKENSGKENKDNMENIENKDESEESGDDDISKTQEEKS